MPVTRPIGVAPDALFCAAVCRHISPRETKVRQLSGRTRPDTLADMAMSPPPVVTCQHPRKSSTRCSSDNSKELDDDDSQTGVQLPFEAMDQRSIDEMTMSESRASTTAFSRRAGAVAAFTNVGKEQSRVVYKRSWGLTTVSCAF